MKVVPYVDNADKWHKIIRAARMNNITTQVGFGKHRTGYIPVNAIKQPVHMISPLQAVVDRAKSQMKQQKEESRDQDLGSYKLKRITSPMSVKRSKPKKKVPKTSSKRNNKKPKRRLGQSTSPKSAWNSN
ncbi:unnamed protein product [Owenia fusiformis]|uniref:Uncharacterized protein n=1 Tax=Owenia fusiformis TaxID=6347 RepID=A0A8S4PP84_OWEFU|nr:unnamed protein product [Owenia fusiformis]